MLKPIKHFEGYLIGDDGTVISLKKNLKRIMSHYQRVDGYMTVMLCKHGKYAPQYVHRLVAKAFVKSRKGCRDINHKDGNKTNNHYKNLEWCNQQQNIKHAVKNKLHLFGERHAMHKLTLKDVRKIRSVFKSTPAKILAKKFRVSKSAIWRIKNYSSWALV